MIRLWKPEMHADTGKQIVGLAIYKIMLEREIVQIEFTYRRKNGSLFFPNIFEMARSKMAVYPEEVVKGIRLKKIPLADFKEAIRR
jgi:hypothetical protein